MITCVITENFDKHLSPCFLIKSSLIENENLFENDKDTSEILNNFFADIVPKLNIPNYSEFVIDTNKDLDPIM